MEFAKALVEAGALLPQAVLRFHDVTAMPAGGMRAEGSFDVEVDIGSRNWYVRLLHPEKAYIVDLGWRGRDGRFHRVARSNRGETPRAWPCAETGQQRMRVVEIDGIIHADPVGEAEFERPSAAASEVLGHRPRIEMPQEYRLAVVGVGGAPTMTAEAERVRETGSLHRPTPPSSPSPVGPTEEPRSKMEAVYEGRQIVPSEEKWGGGQKPPEGEGRGPAGTDLSFQCDGLFVSGLSSSRITVEGEKDDQDDG
jgi:hypothetical protein